MLKEEIDYTFLLSEYRSLWNNRLVSLGDLSHEETLKEAIKRELLDENAHPRVRKDRFEKYYFSIKKIMNSSLIPNSKLSLIQLYLNQMEELYEGT